MVAYPCLEHAIKSRKVKKQDIAEVLNISMKSLYNKLTGATQFTWQEVLLIRSRFFPDMALEELFERL